MYTGNISRVTTSIDYLGEDLFVKAQYTYEHHHKNPYSAIPGHTYDYASANGYDDRNKWYSTSQYFVLYDENGNPQVLSDQDPSKTVVGVGPGNYVTTTQYYENVTASWLNFSFTYEKSNNSAAAKKTDKITIQKILERSTIKSIREKVNLFKKQSSLD